MDIDVAVENGPVASTSSAPASPKPDHVELPPPPRDPFRAKTRFIQPGDMVILFISRDRPTTPLTVTPGQSFINAFGSFPHSSFVGRPFGSQVRSTNNRGFLTLLRPTPELWTLSLPHRTQILYAPDMSFITLKLGLSPGARVVEAGTGSGSFTHFLARTVGRPGKSSAESAAEQTATPAGRGWKGLEGVGVSSKGKGIQTRPPREKEDDEGESAPASGTGTPQPASSALIPPFKELPSETEGGSSAAVRREKVLLAQSQGAPTPDYDAEASPRDGKVWTFEFHRERAARAREEIVAHGLAPLVSTSHRNVCLYGFPSSLDGQADAVFLDLPAPWEAVPFLPQVLDPNTMTQVCCFSPCIEQVLKTVKALNDCGFRDVETYESLVRTHESLKGALMEMPLRGIDKVKDKLRETIRKRDRMSEGQRKRAKERKEQEAAGVLGGGDVDGAANGDEGGDDDDADDGGEGGDEDMGGDGDGDGDEDGNTHAANGTDGSSPKRRKTDSHDGSSSATPRARAPPQHQSRPVEPQVVPLSTGGSAHRAADKAAANGVLVRSNMYSRVHGNMRGHTSYLTFASLLPRR